MRPEVKQFAEVMEFVLQQNDRKGGWQDCTPTWLAIRLVIEVGELYQRLLAFYDEESDEGADKYTIQKLTEECVDVANYAMMIADNVGGLN